MQTDLNFKGVSDLVNVMVIDDQQTMRIIIRQLLHQQHIDHVTEAANGKQALEMLMDREVPDPDVILCDLHMDVMDGLEFIHRLRRDNNGTPVLILTGDRNELIHEVSKQIGANKVLTKPISAPELADEIHFVIGAY